MIVCQLGGRNCRYDPIAQPQRGGQHGVRCRLHRGKRKLNDVTAGPHPNAVGQAGTVGTYGDAGTLEKTDLRSNAGRCAVAVIVMYLELQAGEIRG